MRRAAWLCVAGAVAIGTGAVREASLESVRWMSGCWASGTEDDRIVEEQWMAPRGSVMLGMSRTTDDGRTREYEQAMIRVEGADLVFAAKPSGQDAAEFTSTHIAADSVVFANPAHDFPQTISYRSAAGGDSLVATIGGPMDGSARSFRFGYARVRCPGVTD